MSEISLTVTQKRGDLVEGGFIIANKQIGYFFYYHRGSGVVSLDKFSLEAPLRLKGYGSLCYHQLEDHFRKEGFHRISLAADSLGGKSSHGFWEKMGFKSHKEDRYLMEKELQVSK